MPPWQLVSSKLGGLPLAYQPGTKWIYSLSMDVQGAIIDLWFPTRAQALTWGRRTVTVTIH